MTVVLWLWIILPLILHSSLSLFGLVVCGAFALWASGFGLRASLEFQASGGFAGEVSYVPIFATTSGSRTDGETPLILASKTKSKKKQPVRWIPSTNRWIPSTNHCHIKTDGTTRWSERKI